MKNIPRIYIDQKLAVGTVIPCPPDTGHYLANVMRTNECLAFNDGAEYTAVLQKEQISKKIINYQLSIINLTDHTDPANDIILAFAPIKQARLEEMVNMATQLGVGALQPVITDHVTAKHINWERIKKIAIEAAEQSNRNSVPKILDAIKFDDFISTYPNIIFADERSAYQPTVKSDKNNANGGTILIGPEGGFSDPEFAKLDAAGAIGISLGKTILRAEVAAAIAIAKILDT